MHPLDDAANIVLTWRTVPGTANERLENDDVVYGTLAVEDVPEQKRALVGRTADGAWAFRHVGLLKPQITAQALHASMPVTVVQHATQAGVEVNTTFGTYRLEYGTTVADHLRWLDSTGTLLIQGAVQQHISRVDLHLTLTAAGVACPARGLLVTLVRFLGQ